MKSILKAKVITLLIFSISFTSLFLINNQQYFDESENNYNLKLSDISEKIHIDNNWSDAEIAGICTGYGNSTHPYIIEDLIIDAGNIGHCILIENTNDYFIIENCTLYNSDLTYLITHAGITLINVTNGVITNNTLYDNFDGIYLNSSNNNAIIGNVIYNSLNFGIELLYSNDSIFYLNSLESNTLDIFYLYSHNTYNSQKKIIYTYNGKNYTNYLGNYWENYPGLDENGDGIGDSAHTIVPFEPGPGKSVLEDKYPLIEPLSNYKIIGFAEEGAIPGYYSFLIIGIMSITLILVIKKIKSGLKMTF